MTCRSPYWPWGVGLDKRQARRLRRRLARWISRHTTLPTPTQGETP